MGTMALSKRYRALFKVRKEDDCEYIRFFVSFKMSFIQYTNNHNIGRWSIPYAIS